MKGVTDSSDGWSDNYPFGHGLSTRLQLAYLILLQIKRLNQTPMDPETFSRAIEFRSGIDVLVDILGTSIPATSSPIHAYDGEVSCSKISSIGRGCSSFSFQEPYAFANSSGVNT